MKFQTHDNESDCVNMKPFNDMNLYLKYQHSFTTRWVLYCVHCIWKYIVALDCQEDLLPGCNTTGPLCFVHREIPLDRILVKIQQPYILLTNTRIQALTSRPSTLPDSLQDFLMHLIFPIFKCILSVYYQVTLQAFIFFFFSSIEIFNSICLCVIMSFSFVFIMMGSYHRNMGTKMEAISF